MGRTAKWWLVAAGVAVAVPVVGVVAAALIVDPNVLRPWLVSAVENATGRRLEIRGAVRISRSLWPTLELDDVRLANLPGGSRADMARADRITVALSLPALLRHRVEVAQLGLVGPNILFETVKGVPNWRFDLPDKGAGAAGGEAAASAGADAGAGQGGAGQGSFSLMIRAASVVNGMVTWHLPARTKVLGIRSMAVEHPRSGGPIEMRSVLVYGDNQPFDLTVSTRPTAGLAGPWATKLSFSAYDTVATATGTMDTAGVYDLAVEGHSGALEKLNALLPSMDLPVVRDMTLATRLGNGAQPGDLPVVGATKLHFASAALPGIPALQLGVFDVAIDKPGGTATVSGAGFYRKDDFKVSGTTGVPVHPDGRVSVPVNLVVTSAGAGFVGSVGVKGTVALRTLVFDGLDAGVTVTTPALAALRPVLSSLLPGLTNVKFAGHVVVPATLARVGFSGATLATGQGDVAGEGTISLGPAIGVQAKLKSERLDLDAMLLAFGIDVQPPEGGAGTGPVFSAAPIDWGMLKGPVVDASLAAGTLTFLKQIWRGVDVGMVLKEGRLQDGSLRVAVPGGQVGVVLTADANREPVPVRLSIDAPALPLALVARYAGLPGRASGSARVEARLSAAGGSLRALAGSLDGTVSLSAVGGQMENAAFLNLTGPAVAALGIKVPAAGETAVRCLGVQGTFAHGVGNLSTIALETTYLSLEGTGQVDLGRETLSLQLAPMASVSGSMVKVPVAVSGPFRGITGRLEAEGLDKVGLLVDALFGGDRATACADAGLLPK